MVPIRDMKTHKHLPGVKCGNMGPKLGYTDKDNGWLVLDKVRIPKENMLSRFMAVDEDNSISIRGDLRMLYSTMMKVRNIIVIATKVMYLISLTITIRYSIVRRQFKNVSGTKEETQLIDYQT